MINICMLKSIAAKIFVVIFIFQVIALSNIRVFGLEECNFVNGICSDCGKYQSVKEKDKVFEIENAGQLFWISNQVNQYSNSFKNKIVKLVCDITMPENTEFTPIGCNDNNVFFGTFDGLGHTISNLNINSSFDNVGLFGYFCGEIINLGIVDCNINADTMFAGGLVGQNDGKIINSFARGKVKGNAFSGGICGYNYGIISNCYSTVSTNGILNYCGAVCGLNVTAQNLSNCYYLDSERGIGTGDGDVTAKNAEQFKSGEVTVLLQNNQSEQIWGQALGADNYPIVSNNVNLKVNYAGEAIKEGKQFIGWAVNNKLYRPNMYINGENPEALFISLRTLNGASMKLSEPSGLRFKTEINKSDFESIIKAIGDKNIVLSTLITPTDYIVSRGNGVFTKQSVDDGNPNTTDYAEVLAKGWIESNETVLTYSGSIVNIRDNNITRDFSAVGCACVTYFDGTKGEFYADFDIQNHSRNVYNIASKVIENNYSELSNKQIKMVESYINSVCDISVTNESAVLINKYNSSWKISSVQSEEGLIITVKVDDKYTNDSHTGSLKIKSLLINKTKYPLSYVSDSGVKSIKLLNEELIIIYKK